MRHLWKFMILITLVTGCGNRGNTDKSEDVLSAFDEAGFGLVARDESSSTFDFPQSKEDIYQFNGGSFYFFYDYKQAEQMEERIRATLAESEFQYAPQVFYGKDVCIIFVPEAEDSEVSEKVMRVFSQLKDQ